MKIGDWPDMERRGSPVADSEVRRFEQHIGAELPDDYRRFLLEVNGGRTADAHCTFTVLRWGRRTVCTLNSLLSLSDPQPSRALPTGWSPGGKPLGRLLEIGVDESGAQIVLVLAGERRGEIWYFDTPNYDLDEEQRADWFSRTDVFWIAASFTEFIAGLRPLEDQP